MHNTTCRPAPLSAATSSTAPRKRGPARAAGPGGAHQAAVDVECTPVAFDALWKLLVIAALMLWFGFWYFRSAESRYGRA